ncbi:TetR/AcrR family transcriptional regulator [Laribacter hongkongensis]|uniref:Probable transcription regulator, TetR Family n=3 Tax=Laribacter hongkongensis TaxID=168471 RepID=C1D777_LARHH|nr:helix-turn-helix domain-containing protein [Laribacter hongkongensis]ACO74317.1 Probable transcription regulator, TetR Family [Laribacter hongkongensis HLHK9]ASJ24431.1 putative transcription regulator, TetR Family [Laribacter hongkongensis]MBE5528641.1 TetR family transcriptional regulator [Laribacter hongkongensis]MCG8997247.1 TetR/AcrR family transcriptional regulator [Laribacter hongkongensis]MCG9003294.1 TetR/AcrR family transcriptional regulator [Laribacter hongkongensis]
MSIMGRLSFKDQAFRLREQAVLDATTTLLASKGFDLMTMDDVAEGAGLSKPSLYKHFRSKEALATEVMIRLLDRALEHLDAQDPVMDGKARLDNLMEWALRTRLEGGLPFLPSTSPHVRDMLMHSVRYSLRIYRLHTQLQQLVEQARTEGSIRNDLPTDVLLYAYYSRTCDPAVDYMKDFGRYDDDEIIACMRSIMFSGIAAS